ncbi:Neuropilin-1 [Manis pentadactyla]|nr:Neuropilin-1 [Manis pentadactyla]
MCTATLLSQEKQSLINSTIHKKFPVPGNMHGENNTKSKVRQQSRRKYLHCTEEGGQESFIQHLLTSTSNARFAAISFEE